MSPRARFRSSAGLVLLLAGATACDGEPTAGREARIARDTFIQVMVELRRAANEADEQAGFEERKREILSRHDASEEDLRQFVRVHGPDIEYMRELWEEIEDRLSATRGDSAQV